MKKQLIKFTIIDFTGGCDGVKALYADDFLVFYGDTYHDDIDVKIKSFIEGVKWCGAIISEEDFYSSEKWVTAISENGEVPPKELKYIN